MAPTQPNRLPDCKGNVLWRILLEKLLGAGLVDKSYAKNKGLCYELTMSRITIDIATDSLEKYP